MMSLGSKKFLGEEDMWSLPPDEDAEALGKKFSKHWKNTRTKDFLGEKAIIAPRILRNRTIGFASLVNFCVASSYFTVLYSLPLYFQAVEGSSAMRSGVETLPFIMAVIFALIVSSSFISKSGIYIPWLVGGTALGTLGAGLGVWYLLQSTPPACDARAVGIVAPDESKQSCLTTWQTQWNSTSADPSQAVVNYNRCLSLPSLTVSALQGNLTERDGASYLEKRAVPNGGYNSQGRKRLGQTFDNARNIAWPAQYAIRLIGKQYDNVSGDDFRVYDLDLTRASSVYYVPDMLPSGTPPGRNADNWIGSSALVQFGDRLANYQAVVFSPHHDIDDTPQDAQTWVLFAGRGDRRTYAVGLGTGRGPQFHILSSRYMTGDDTNTYGNGQIYGGIA